MTRVVIADDDPDILESTQVLLDMEGHDVRTVTAGAHIFGLVSEDPPDILLQDVHMPGLDLEALIAQIRAHPRAQRVAIVLFTAAPRDPAALKERWQVQDVLPKPFEMDDLLGMVERWAAGAPPT